MPVGPATGSAHWLPAPNGIHFHAPDGLWVEGSAGASAGEVTALMVHHDVDDVRTLVDLAKGLEPAEYAREPVTRADPAAVGPARKARSPRC